MTRLSRGQRRTCQLGGKRRTRLSPLAGGAGRSGGGAKPAYGRPLAARPQSEPEAFSGPIPVLVKGEGDIVLQTPSSVNRWRYVSLIPQDIYLKNPRYIITVILGYIAFCLCCGFLLSLWLSKKNYRPLKDLGTLLRGESGRRKIPEENEFTFIEESLRSILDAKKTDKSRLRRQSPVLRNALLAGLLRGQSAFPGAEHSLSEHNIHFKGPYFLIILFRIDNIGGKLAAAGSMETKQSLELALLVIENITEELFNEQYVAYTAEIDSNPVCILNFGSAPHPCSPRLPSFPNITPP